MVELQEPASGRYVSGQLRQRGPGFVTRVHGYVNTGLQQLVKKSATPSLKDTKFEHPLYAPVTENPVVKTKHLRCL
jgi:hypothetical protein